MTAYNPSTDEGPLRYIRDAWYWNGKFTSEFMVDGDLKLSDCTDFDFISHHKTICRLNRHDCTDRGASTERTGGRVLAFLFGNNLHVLDHVLKKPSIFVPARSLSDTVDTGIAGIVRALGGKADRFAGAIADEAPRQALVRGALALYGADQN